MKWFTSDLHFDHKNIIKYDNLPFSSIEEMNKSILDTINSYVKDSDELFFLGDFAIHNRITRIQELLNNITCKNIVWIYGNHDSHKYAQYFTNIKFYDYYELKSDNMFLVLCHYPFESWKHSNAGSVHLYGHTHKNPIDTKPSPSSLCHPELVSGSSANIQF
jgi:calcineurin-like phosphoesterase family protein